MPSDIIKVFESTLPDGTVITVVQTPLHSIYIYPDSDEAVFSFKDEDEDKNE